MKLYKSINLLLLCVMGLTPVFAQSGKVIKRCGFEATKPLDTFEQWMQNKQDRLSKQRSSKHKVYRIPVVVHISHHNEPEGTGANLSTATIHQLIENLNNDFRRKKGTLGYNEHPAGVDTRIEFQLAQISPTGLSTSGINRINYSEIDSTFTSYWNPKVYLNIWFDSYRTLAFLGKAVFPETDLPGIPSPTKDTVRDGVLINSKPFQPGIKTPFNLGRTLTHEIGHWLGLRHIWGDGDCSKDDFCDDTPPMSHSNNTCTGPIPTACDGQPAMIENYMDYSEDACMNIFTRDQMLRMHTVLENSPRRKELSTSPGLIRNPINSMQLVAYPNPAQKNITLEFGLELIGKTTQIKIYSLQGRLLKTTQFLATQRMIFTLPITSSNLLFLQVQNDVINETRKIIVTR